MFSFGSGVVSLNSKKQPIIALSSTEAKYRGATIATCEVVWLQKLLSDLGQSVDVLIVIYCDNISSMLTTRSIMLGQSTLRCTTTLLEKKF
jgi:hypothetical protein